MLDWTDRHCRAFHRLITRHTRLYTEMVTTGALIHGDRARHLDFGDDEHPVALQLGGSEPDDLATCARLAKQWGYDEVNLNCGCPSERVQRGAFGACLMAEPALVRDGVAAMLDAVGGALPVTVKHRIGIDRVESYDFVRDFVGTVADGGCRVFIVHARNAWLQGLSPKENREIPPLRHDWVHRLKADFPAFTIAVNGGIADNAAIAAHLGAAHLEAAHLGAEHPGAAQRAAAHVSDAPDDLALDGVMVGRAAYHDPALMADWDARFWGDARARAEPADDAWREAVEARMVAVMAREAGRAGVPWAHIARHMLGLWNGRPGARRWRQVWSDHRLKTLPAAEVAALARAAREGREARMPA